MDRSQVGHIRFFQTSMVNLIAWDLQARRFTIEGVEVSGSASLSGCRGENFTAVSLTIGGGLTFKGSQVDSINLSGTIINGETDFSRFRSESAIFDRIHCAAKADFAECKFSSVLRFEGAVFEKTVTFLGSTWPSPSAVAGAFRGAVFNRFVDFRGENPPSPAAFDGCSFRAEAQFDRLAFALDRPFRSALAEAKGGKELESLENGCRVLKLAAEATRDRLSEQRFHRYELICRRRSKATPRSERFFSTIYGLAGDYGGSMVRPIANIAVLWSLMAMVFAVWGGLLVKEPITVADVLVQSIEVSGRNIFHPFGIWIRSGAPPVCPSAEIENILGWCSGSGPRLAFRLVSTIEALVAGILFFLAVLAIKRRFQIT